MTTTCRMELCRYWPGEGCMAGVMPCDDEDQAREPARDPVTHWTPEEEFYAECGDPGIEGDTGIINPDKVTCPGCRAAIDEAEGPTP